MLENCSKNLEFINRIMIEIIELIIKNKNCFPTGIEKLNRLESSV